MKLILIDSKLLAQCQETTRQAIQEMPERVPGLTQTAVAARAGVNIATLRNLMKGHDLKPSNLRPIQDALIHFGVVKEAEVFRMCSMQMGIDLAVKGADRTITHPQGPN